MVNKLKGKKTYLCIGACAVVYFGNLFFPQYVTTDLANALYPIFGFAGVAAFKAGVTRTLKETVCK
jgi:hypothetical protein